MSKSKSRKKKAPKPVLALPDLEHAKTAVLNSLTSASGAIRETEIGTSVPGTIEDQQLLLDEHGFGYQGTRAPRTGQTGDGRQQMQKQDRQIAHRTILTGLRIRKNVHEFAIRHACNTWGWPMTTGRCTGKIWIGEA